MTSAEKVFIVQLELGAEVYSAKRRAYYQLVRWIHSPASMTLSRYQWSFLFRSIAGESGAVLVETLRILSILQESREWQKAHFLHQK
jgi:hypothetical protein